MCTACADYASQKIIECEPSQEDELVKKIVNIIKTNNISDDNVNNILEAIGSRQKTRSKIRPY